MGVGACAEGMSDAEQRPRGCMAITARWCMNEKVHVRVHGACPASPKQLQSNASVAVSGCPCLRAGSWHCSPHEDFHLSHAQRGFALRSAEQGSAQQVRSMGYQHVPWASSSLPPHCVLAWLKLSARMRKARSARICTRHSWASLPHGTCTGIARMHLRHVLQQQLLAPLCGRRRQRQRAAKARAHHFVQRAAGHSQYHQARHGGHTQAVQAHQHLCRQGKQPPNQRTHIPGRQART